MHLTINHGDQEGFVVPASLFCIYVHFEASLQLDRIMVLVIYNLLEPAPDQGFVEFRQFGGLAADEILKRCDAFDLFVSGHCVNSGPLFLLPKLEDFSGNLIVSFLVVGFFEQFLLQGQ